MRTKRLLQSRSRRFTPRINDYTYPQLRMERPRVSQRSSRSEGPARSGTGTKGAADAR